jgi:AraC-like DNA-binding protein/uncharacterized cupin superfamily protein
MALTLGSSQTKSHACGSSDHTQASRAAYRGDRGSAQRRLDRHPHREPRAARFHWAAPWRQAFLDIPGAAGFHVAVEGECWSNGRGREPVRLRTGDVLLLPHGTAHVMSSNPDTPSDEDHPRPADRLDEADPDTVTLLCGAYRLDPARAHPLLRDLPDVVHIPARPDLRPELAAAIGLLTSELDHPGGGTDAILPPLLDMVLLYVLRAWLADGDEVPGPRRGWSEALGDPSVAAALQAIHENPAAPWTVASLAAEAGLSRAPFAKRFTALVGQPPLAYLTWWRMTKAAAALRADDAPLRSVAAQIGYGSEFAFAAAFKRWSGLSPGAFRRSEHDASDAAG